MVVGTITPADFRAEGAELFPWLLRPLYAGFDVARSGAAAKPKTAQQPQRTTVLASSQRPRAPDKPAIVLDAMTYELARPLGLEPADIDPNRSLAAYGIDPLIAVELRNWLANTFKATLTAFEIMVATKIEDMIELVVERTATRPI